MAHHVVGDPLRCRRLFQEDTIVPSLFVSSKNPATPLLRKETRFKSRKDDYGRADPGLALGEVCWVSETYRGWEWILKTLGRLTSLRKKRGDGWESGKLGNGEKGK